MKRETFLSEGVTLSVAETGDGHPFMFQHGLCGDAGQTAQVFPDDAAFRCITLECRGHGQSECGDKAALSIETFASDVVRFTKERGLEKSVLGGISMGAAISLRIAVLFPDLVRALVIARPAWLDTAAPINMRPNLAAGDLLQSHPRAEALQLFEASEVAAGLKDSGPDNLLSIRGFFSRDPLDVTSALLRRISLDGPGVSELQIRNLKLPTLIIGNRRDHVHPLSYAQQLADWIPDSRFVEITPKADSPELYRSDFRAALSTFLKEI